MMCQVLHQVSRTFAHLRSLDHAARSLRFTSCRQYVFTSAHPSLQICCFSDCTYNKEKHKRFVRVSGVSPKYLPQTLPTVSYSNEERYKSNLQRAINDQAKKPDRTSTVEQTDNEKNLSIFQRFKKMYRDYWYVLVPVHVITSLGWYGGFYYAAKSGVDIVAIVEALGISNHIPEVLKDSSAGYLAVAYALYKIATPLRYMVTIGGTTISIKYLKEYGYIKPIPPKAKLKEMYQEKKENFKEKRQHFADELKQKREQLKERRQTLMRERRQQAQK